MTSSCLVAVWERLGRQGKMAGKAAGAWKTHLDDGGAGEDEEKGEEQLASSCCGQMPPGRQGGAAGRMNGLQLPPGITVSNRA